MTDAREYQVRWRARNKEKVRGYLNRWRAANKEKVRLQNKRRWEKKRTDDILMEKKRSIDRSHFQKTRQKPLKEKSCQSCGITFETRRSLKKFCSRKCERKVQALRARERRQQGLDPYYKSEKHRKTIREYRNKHREMFRYWDQRYRSAEYWNDRLKEGERAWLRKNQAELRSVKKALKNEDHPGASPSPRTE